MQNILCLALLLFCTSSGFRTCWGESYMAEAGSAEGAGEESYGPFYDISGCSMFPDDITDLFYNLTFTSPIVCDEDKQLVIPPGQNIVLHAENDMKFERMHLLVSPDSRLTLLAGNSITIARNQEHTGIAVVEIEGELFAHAGEMDHWPTGASKFTVPRSGRQDLLTQFGDGALFTDQKVTFGKHTLTIAAATTEDDVSSKAGHQEAKESEKVDAAQDLATTRLKVGQVLQGEEELTSTDGAYRLWAGRYGSLFFSSNVDSLHEDGPGALVRANKSKVKGVLKVRARLEKEKQSEEAKVRTSWTPWGRRYNRRLQTAKDHAGEVRLTVDNRACLEVTVDGCCVLAKSGPYSREWVNKCRYFRRVRSSEYELCVVSDGLEVQRAGRKVWGVSVPKRHDDTDG